MRIGGPRNRKRTIATKTGKDDRCCGCGGDSDSSSARLNCATGGTFANKSSAAGAMIAIAITVFFQVAAPATATVVIVIEESATIAGRA